VCGFGGEGWVEYVMILWGSFGLMGGCAGLVAWMAAVSYSWSWLRLLGIALAG
jgi:hypothetical protein